MKRKEYIYTLASSPLPKSVIDKQIQALDEPEYITPYENAVLKGFKGNEAYFDKKYGINDKLNTESTNIRQEQKTALKGISDTIESQFGEVNDTINLIQTDILKNTDEIEKEKELSNKRINATNEKIDKVKVTINEINTNIETQSKQSKQELLEKISIINDNTSEAIGEIKEIKKITISKADKEHKHSIMDIDKLQSTIDSINDNIDNRTTIDEVKETLKEFYTKKETYSKKEINTKIDSIKPSGSTIIQSGGSRIDDNNTTTNTTRSSTKIQSELNSVTPVRGAITGTLSNQTDLQTALNNIGFGTRPLTNAQKTALTPSLGMMVYTTDLPEALYVYRSTGRHALTTPITAAYATRNPSDKDANIALSGSDLIATSGGTAWKSVRSTLGKSSGKRYREVTVGGTGADFIIGVATSGANINSYLGEDVLGRGYYSNGGSAARVNNNYFDPAYPASGGVYVNGDVISVLLDMDAGEVGFYYNGTDEGVAYSGLTGTIYAMASLYSNASSYTVNFGASAFNYTVPVGYNSGLYP